MAVKDAVEKASPVVLEPVMAVEVTMPEQIRGTDRRPPAAAGSRGQDPRAQPRSSALSRSPMFGYATDLVVDDPGPGDI
jgi:elongation factor G